MEFADVVLEHWHLCSKHKLNEELSQSDSLFRYTKNHWGRQVSVSDRKLYGCLKPLVHSQVNLIWFVES